MLQIERIKRFSIREIVKPTINKGTSNSNTYEITGLKYEIDPEGNWVCYNDVKNMIEDHVATIKKLQDAISMLLGNHRE
jgi:hypothetical protein